MEVGVTIYSTDPTVLLGFVNNWLIVAPDPALAPVMPPTFAPMVHAKLLGKEAAKEIFVVFPLQIVAVADVEIVAEGFTVTVIV